MGAVIAAGAFALFAAVGGAALRARERRRASDRDYPFLHMLEDSPETRAVRALIVTAQRASNRAE